MNVNEARLQDKINKTFRFVPSGVAFASIYYFIFKYIFMYYFDWFCFYIYYSHLYLTTLFEKGFFFFVFYNTMLSSMVLQSMYDRRNVN